MSKHHHQSKAEQISKKTNGSRASASREKLPLGAIEPMSSQGIQQKEVVGDSSIQLRAYQIYSERGGSALDNWLEAERTLNVIDPLDHALMNMGKSEVYN